MLKMTCALKISRFAKTNVDVRFSRYTK